MQCARFYDGDRARGPCRPRRARRRLGERPAARRAVFGQAFRDRRAIRRGRRPMPRRRGLSDREPVVLPAARRPVLAGRTFTDGDTTEAPQVCIVDEAFVRRYLKAARRSARDCCVNAMVQPPQAVLREIVGVVTHVKERPDEPEAPPQIYVPIAQNTWWLASLVVQPASGRRPRSHQPSAPRWRASSRDRPRARSDADRHPHRSHGAAPLPRRAGRRVRAAGADAGAGRRLRRARLLGAAAHARVRRAHRARCERGHVLRLVVSSAGGVIGTGVADRSGLCRPSSADRFRRSCSACRRSIR